MTDETKPKTFVEFLQNNVDSSLTEKDKKKYENPRYNIKVSGFDMSYIENDNYLKVSYERENNITTISLKADYVRKNFFKVLSKGFKNVDETVTYAQIQELSLFRAFNYVVSEFLKTNNHLFI